MLNSLKLIFSDHSTRNFKIYLKQKPTKINEEKKIFLVEFPQVPSNYIALSLFLPQYCKINKTSIFSYRMIEKKKFNSIKQKLHHHFSVLKQSCWDFFCGSNHKKTQPLFVGPVPH